MPKGVYQHKKGYKHTEEWKDKHRERMSGKNNPFYDKKHSEETKRKISEANKGHKKPKDAYTFPKGITPWNKGKSLSEKIKEKMSLAKRRKIPQNINQIKGWWKGKHHSEETKRKMSEAHKGKPGWNKGNVGFMAGKNHWNWKGGISNNPYPREFNAELKLKIRTRDNFTCCLCGRTEREELEELNRVLCVNHKDFNKNNCREENLNTLCVRCNVKINREREKWINYFNQYPNI